MKVLFLSLLALTLACEPTIKKEEKKREVEKVKVKLEEKEAEKPKGLLDTIMTETKEAKAREAELIVAEKDKREKIRTCLEKGTLIQDCLKKEGMLKDDHEMLIKACLFSGDSTIRECIVSSGLTRDLFSTKGDGK